MKKFYIVIFVLISFNSLASEENQIKTLMQNYLKALDQTTSQSLKKITSDKYFQNLNKNGILNKTRELNKQSKNKSLDFDMKIKKAAVSKDLIFVNIKDVKSKNYGDYWYLVKKIDGQYIIDDMQFLD